MTDLSPVDPRDAFAELGRINLAETDMPQVLDRVARLALLSLPAAAEVSVTLVRQDAGITAASTGELARTLDEQQYHHGHGPCLSAAQTGDTLTIPDTASERRWADFAADAHAAGVASSLSVGLPVQQSITGALNIYALTPGAFDDEAVRIAETFAGYAAVALSNAELYSSTAALAEQMQQAMATRSVIEQAKGVLVAQQGCTPDEAFDLLVRASQTGNRKLRDVAAGLVEGAQRSGP